MWFLGNINRWGYWLFSLAVWKESSSTMKAIPQGGGFRLKAWQMFGKGRKSLYLSKNTYNAFKCMHIYFLNWTCTYRLLSPITVDYLTNPYQQTWKASFCVVCRVIFLWLQLDVDVWCHLSTTIKNGLKTISENNILVLPQVGE